MFDEDKDWMSALLNSDYYFIISLDAKLRETLYFSKTPNCQRLHYGEEPKSFTSTEHRYKDEIMNEDELEKLLNIIDKGEYVLFQRKTTDKSSVEFGLRELETNLTLLMFQEEQLPEGYDFAKLSKYFMKPENLRKDD